MPKSNKTLIKTAERGASAVANPDKQCSPIVNAGTRQADVRRETKETQIRVRLNLDGSGLCSCSVPVPFFAHMLDLLAKHSLIDMELEGTGDVHIDAHHTVEDVGIVLGQALKAALGDRAGIERYGEAYVPMEESLARCVLDLCNRPFLRYDAQLPKAKIGEFDAELAEEFFRAFAYNAGITMHLALLTAGGNLHHVVEAMFKAVGRALGKAVTKNPRIKGVLSTKGKL
ncbi:MAG: imidazoleglycerol-phosphate dehydratase HisB [Candidatus Sumerlaeaceae bacterium]